MRHGTYFLLVSVDHWSPPATDRARWAASDPARRWRIVASVHLVPPERASRHVIDDHRVCEAIAGLPDPADLAERARRFGLLADPSRLALLLCIATAGPIAVTDLAVATGLADSTVSQALRHLRAHNAVRAERDGRVLRYSLADAEVAALLRPTEDASAHHPS
jgi:DNA-binding transcriptional ArsR family regulator